MVLCDSGTHDKLKIYTHGHVYIISIIMKVVYSEITSNIEIKNIIPYFLGAGRRIWPLNYSFCFSKHNGCAW